MRFIRCLFAFVALPLLAGGSEQQPLEKGDAPWALTIEQRLSVRLDPAHIATQARDGKRFSTVTGCRNPELFLPIELFTSLMSGLEGDAALRTTTRAGLRSRIVAFGFDESQFWNQLGLAASPYLSLSLREDIQDRDAVGRERCRSRAAALATARQRFGVETFNRFLYTVVAPGLTISTADGDGSTAEHLKFLEGGCQ